MALFETYREQVIRERGQRARKALLLARFTGLLLMLLVAVILRTEPQIRADATAGALAFGLWATGRQEATLAEAPRAQAAQPPGIRINRPASGGGAEELQEVAGQLGKRLAARPLGADAD